MDQVLKTVCQGRCTHGSYHDCYPDCDISACLPACQPASGPCPASIGPCLPPDTLGLCRWKRSEEPMPQPMTEAGACVPAAVGPEPPALTAHIVSSCTSRMTACCPVPCALLCTACAACLDALCLVTPGGRPASTPARLPAAVSKMVGVSGAATQQVEEEMRGTYPGAASDVQKAPAKGGRS